MLSTILLTSLAIRCSEPGVPKHINGYLEHRLFGNILTGFALWAQCHNNILEQLLLGVGHVHPNWPETAEPVDAFIKWRTRNPRAKEWKWMSLYLPRHVDWSGWGNDLISSWLCINFHILNSFIHIWTQRLGQESKSAPGQGDFRVLGNKSLGTESWDVSSSRPIIIEASAGDPLLLDKDDIPSL